MRRDAWLASLLCTAVALGAALGACTSRSAPPRFPHPLHLARLDCGKEGQPACLDCNDCHSVSKSDRVHKLPGAATCTRCHQDDAPEVLPVLATTPERISGPIAFDHDRHLAMDGISGQCVRCHAGVVQPAGSTMPPMAKCFSCHEHEEQWKSGSCGPCHSRASLERTLPQTFLHHDQSFVRHHGIVATQEERLCRSCHSQAQCADCHDVTQDLGIERREPERIERNFVHRGDFLVRHAIEAREQPGRCVRCHTVDTCDACHVERGVSGSRVQARNPHPVGWVGNYAGSKSFHGREARRDLLSCASCHDQGPATNCIRCHRVGGPGGNPHPSGWKSSQGQDAAMCRYCHE